MLELKYRISKYGQVYHKCNSRHSCDDCSGNWDGCIRHKIYKPGRISRKKVDEWMQMFYADVPQEIIETKNAFYILLDVPKEDTQLTTYLWDRGYRDVNLRMWRKEVKREQEEAEEVLRLFRGKM